MNTRIKSISFTISPKKNNNQDFFPLNSVFEITFKEGISDLYSGSLSFYADNALNTSDIQCQIGRQLSISVEITDTLKVDGIESDYVFNRFINGIVSSVRFLGKTQNVICTKSNKAAYIYKIDFVSPFDVLKRREYKYRDKSFSELTKKLELFLSKPNRVLFGNDYEFESNLPIKFELLDNESKTSFNALPDYVSLQIGSYSPLQALKKIITDCGLNFNIQHGHEDDNFIRVFLSKGYGVHKSQGVTSTYFKEDNNSKYNYDIPIICDQADSGTPKLTSFTMDVFHPEEELFNNDNDFLLYGARANDDAIAKRVEYMTEAISNIRNKHERELTRFTLTASHLIFVPGTVITAKNYLDRDITLVVADAKMHLTCEPNSAFRTSEETVPSIEVKLDAYELLSDREPGSFASFSDNDGIGRKAELRSDSSGMQVFEAIVCNGDGKYLGVWDDTTKEPLEGSICICSGDNTQNPSTFYAIISGQNVPVVVHITSTVPSHEIFNMPRIGQNILIIYGNNKYYLHSFLSSKDTTQVSGDNITERDNSLSSINALASYTRGARVHVWNDTDQSKNVGIKGGDSSESKSQLLTRIHLDKNSSSKEMLKKQILAGTESTIVESMVIQDNSYIYYEAYEGKKEVADIYYHGKSKTDYDELKRDSLKERCAAVAKKYNATLSNEKSIKQKYDDLERQLKRKESLKDSCNTYYRSLSDENEKDKVNKKISEIEKDIESLKSDKTSVQSELNECEENLSKYSEELEIVTDEFLGEIGIPDNYVDNSIADVFKIDHEGNAEINIPNGTLTINAKDINITGSSSISVNSTGMVTVTSTKGVQIGSAGTSMSIIPTSFAVASMPYSNGALSGFGSTFLVDSLQGTSIKTLKFAVNSKYENNFSDSLGGNIKMSKGVLALTGVEVDLFTMSKPTYISKLVQYDAELVNEFAVKLPTAIVSPTGYKYAQGITEGVLFPLVFKTYGYIFGNAWRYGKQIRDVVKTPRKEISAQTVAQLVVGTCDFLCYTIDMLGTLIDVSEEITSLVDEDNWFKKTGLIGKNHSEDIKFAINSLKFALNSVAAHALTLAVKNGFSRGEFCIKGENIVLKALTSSSLTLKSSDNNSAEVALEN
jgi:hypothetical protein